MEVITARNVNDAYHKGLRHLLTKGIPAQSRAGEVLVAPTPVTTVYERPQERVLFDARRDANPFFHLFESLWMLHGSCDARWLDLFVKDFSSRFAEDNGIQHGAYGWRWRHAFGFDQLDAVVARLEKDPNDRQAVIQMWDARDKGIELVGGETVDQTGENDLNGVWKDRPCNTHVYLRIRQEEVDYGPIEHGMKWSSVKGHNKAVKEYNKVLDITVCCRSNDAIWGTYGANAVHFSVLQEYLAARLRVGIGRYYQVSNNFHVYRSALELIMARSPSSFDMKWLDEYQGANGNFVRPMFTHPDTIDIDLRNFMKWAYSYEDGGPSSGEFTNKWFSTTAVPLFMAAKAWRDENRALALYAITHHHIAPDWWRAVSAWMERRIKNA